MNRLAIAYTWSIVIHIFCTTYSYIINKILALSPIILTPLAPHINLPKFKYTTKIRHITTYTYKYTYTHSHTITHHKTLEKIVQTHATYTTSHKPTLPILPQKHILIIFLTLSLTLPSHHVPTTYKSTLNPHQTNHNNYTTPPHQYPHRPYNIQHSTTTITFKLQDNHKSPITSPHYKHTHDTQHLTQHILQTNPPLIPPIQPTIHISTFLYLTHTHLKIPKIKIIKYYIWNSMTLLILSGDIETNPGPLLHILQDLPTDLIQRQKQYPIHNTLTFKHQYAQEPPPTYILINNLNNIGSFYYITHIHLKTPKRKFIQYHTWNNTTLILLCEDIHPNPGPMPDLLNTHPNDHKRRQKHISYRVQSNSNPNTNT